MRRLASARPDRGVIATLAARCFIYVSHDDAYVKIRERVEVDLRTDAENRYAGMFVTVNATSPATARAMTIMAHTGRPPTSWRYQGVSTRER